MEHRNEDDKRQLKFIMSLGELHQSKAAALDADIQDRCIFCGIEKPTFKHTYWECPHLEQHCPTAKHFQQKLLPDFLHEAMLIGLPPALQLHQYQSYWGADFDPDFPGDPIHCGHYFSIAALTHWSGICCFSEMLFNIC